MNESVFRLYLEREVQMRKTTGTIETQTREKSRTKNLKKKRAKHEWKNALQDHLNYRNNHIYVNNL